MIERVLGCAVCAFLVPTVLLLSSLDAVEQNEYGLIYNWVTKKIGSKVYHGGTHLVGFWNKFVVFPATVQTIEFSDRIGYRTSESLHTRTKEGLGLHLSISFQYRLEQEKLPELFALTNVMYEGLFTRIARDQMLEAASEYEGPQYWLQRQDIGDHMRRLVDAKLRESYASLWGLQLLVIDLPDRYEQSITETQVQQQIIKTRTNQQVAAGIRADTDVIKAQYMRDIQVVQAGAQANYTLVTKLAEAEAARRKIAAEGEALGYVRRKLSLTAPAAVQFQELSAYSGLTNASFLANLPGALPVIGIGGAPSQPAAPSGLLQHKPPQAPPARAPEAPPAEAPDREGEPVAEEGDAGPVISKFLAKAAAPDARTAGSSDSSSDAQKHGSGSDAWGSFFQSYADGSPGSG